MDRLRLISSADEQEEQRHQAIVDPPATLRPTGCSLPSTGPGGPPHCGHRRSERRVRQRQRQDRACEQHHHRRWPGADEATKELGDALTAGAVSRRRLRWLPRFRSALLFSSGRAPSSSSSSAASAASSAGRKGLPARRGPRSIASRPRQAEPEPRAKTTRESASRDDREELSGWRAGMGAACAAAGLGADEAPPPPVIGRWRMMLRPARLPSLPGGGGARLTALRDATDVRWRCLR